ncbi:hypothetical protein [Mesorhizobium sp. BE184]|uniref:hypothetical protein n=1 Tax=Mesorhizobium sp. BE184 TaxID=2817714 RepID=UPI00286342D9|nr:hypothetical protein [Mesorhizobium sp. BE184]MDR7035260.1 hypothetical protein [Mesorhizobium sp. BE184]
MKRTDLQAYAQAKVDDSILLLNHHRWSNAYYLAGYSVELALKACIARQVSTDTIPDKAILNGVLSHEYGKLIGLAGLKGDLKEAQDANADFAANWGIVSEWSPDARYRGCAAMEAQLIVQAIMDPNSGVLPWIKRFW